MYRVIRVSGVGRVMIRDGLVLGLGLGLVKLVSLVLIYILLWHP